MKQYIKELFVLLGLVIVGIVILFAIRRNELDMLSWAVGYTTLLLFKMITNEE